MSLFSKKETLDKILLYTTAITRTYIRHIELSRMMIPMEGVS